MELEEGPPRSLARVAPPSPWPALSPAGAAVVAGLWALGLAAVNLLLHPTPFYNVETDLIGGYLPVARELASGRLDPSHYAFKGPGYPLLLALLSRPLGGDVYAAAMILGPLSAGIAAGLTYAMLRAAVSPALATFALLAMLAMPAFLDSAISAGTDAPALALMLASTWWVVRPGGARFAAVAGALAGCAVLTRTNAAFLIPLGLVLAARRAGWRGAVAYGLAAFAPLAIWRAVAAAHGGLPADRNYLNVAWELYGRGLPWSEFEATVGARFHSMLDVLLYAPATAVAHGLRNLAMHRLRDLSELVPPWVGLVALPGLALLARERGMRAYALHALACAVVLAPVFYGARFALYLMPLYVAAAGMTLLRLAQAWGGRRAPAARFAAPALAAALVAASGARAAHETASLLRGAPHETRAAGQTLRRMGVTGAIIARKPHVAHYAGLAFVPLPAGLSLRAVPAWAESHGVRYLFYSPIEQIQAPQFAVLADSGVRLPGFDPLAWEDLGRGRFYAVYRLSPIADSAAFAAAYHAALLRFEARRPDAGDALFFVAYQLLDEGRAAESLERVERLRAAGAEDGPVERLRSSALLELGRLDEAAAACEAAMALEPVRAWHWARLGEIRRRQRRLPEAREGFRKAAEVEPASIAYLEDLGRVEAELGEFRAAGRTFERACRLVPDDARLRRFAIGAWQLAGDRARARRLYDEGIGAGLDPVSLLGDEQP